MGVRGVYHSVKVYTDRHNVHHFTATGLLIRCILERTNGLQDTLNRRFMLQVSLETSQDSNKDVFLKRLLKASTSFSRRRNSSVQRLLTGWTTGARFQAEAGCFSSP
jgi:hypothetical protein